MGSKDAAFRFSVGDPNGARSFVYRVWAQDAATGRANKSDVYLAVRGLAGQFKISLHESGQWQCSLTKPGADFLRSAGYPLLSRHLTKWTRPAQTQSDCINAFAVLVPFCELRHFPDPQPEGSIKWLPAPEPFLMKVVCLLLCPGQFEPGKLKLRSGTVPELLWEVMLATGEFLAVVTWEEQMFDVHMQQILQSRRVVSATPDPEPGSPSTGYIQAVSTEEGQHAWMELRPVPSRKFRIEEGGLLLAVL
jgi:hypothetical protein